MKASSFSFEFFPPRTQEGEEKLKRTLKNLSEFNPEFADFLPERQTVVLNKAIDMGYYDRPRQCTQREIADELNLKQATVSEHLQAAESAIIHNNNNKLISTLYV